MVLMQAAFSNEFSGKKLYVPKDPIDNEYVLVRVMLWCLQASSRSLDQCWSRFLIPYGYTRTEMG